MGDCFGLDALAMTITATLYAFSRIAPIANPGRYPSSPLIRDLGRSLRKPAWCRGAHAESRLL